MKRSAIAFAVALALTSSSSLVAQRGQRPQGQGRPAPAPGESAPANVAATEVINLNTATATQIATLPGIGPKAAELIVQYRQKNGSFKKVEEIMNVRGIGEKTFLKLKSRITVTSAK